MEYLQRVLGYKYKRFWDAVPYVHAGYVRLFDNTEGQGFKSVNRDNEFAFGMDFYNAFRITDRLHATLDLRHYSTASRYKTLDGVRTNRVDLERRVAEKEAEIAAKNETFMSLDNSRQVSEVPYDVLKARAEAADLVVYYYINVDKLNFSELHHLDGALDRCVIIESK